jgi:hypothetical protein
LAGIAQLIGPGESGIVFGGLSEGDAFDYGFPQKK